MTSDSHTRQIDQIMCSIGVERVARSRRRAWTQSMRVALALALIGLGPLAWRLLPRQGSVARSTLDLERSNDLPLLAGGAAVSDDVLLQAAFGSDQREF